MRTALLSKRAISESPAGDGDPIPSIRLISATPSATGMSSEANTSIDRFSFHAPPVPLSPRADNAGPRKRIVPKKSKLGILGAGAQGKGKGKDFSDVVRRVGGGTSSSRGGFEIYVDPTMDSELGEILMVKKKKSRAGLGGLGWGAPMGEVTNVPATQEARGDKTGKKGDKKEEKEKWWTIGRGRKDSKEDKKEVGKKEKENVKESRPYVPPRSKTPEPFRQPPHEESRARFNSFDAGALLSAPFLRSEYPSSTSHEPIREPEHLPAATPTFGGLLAPPTGGPEDLNPQSSIAIRAMRSMRSMARLGSWNQKPEQLSKAAKEKSMGKENPIEKKRKKKKTKETQRSSGSSFEVGTLPLSPPHNNVHKKRSILGLGLPSSIRLPTIRGGSTASSNVVAAQATTDSNRLSVESAAIMGRPRSGSAMTTASAASTGSSLRPMSFSSGTSRASSGASIKWDEEGLETVREQRYKDREFKANVDQEQRRRTSRDSKHSVEGRRRTPLSDVFPEMEAEERLDEMDVIPVVMIETATSDGHSTVSTPVKRARPRPASEQLLAKSRPQGFHEDSAHGMITLLDAATSDLANLINTLDLEATPATPDRSPLNPNLQSLRRSAQGYEQSPTRSRTLRSDVTSISSLRPYAHARASGHSYPAPSDLGQRITDWDKSTLPLKPLAEQATPPPKSPAFTLTHKRTLTPGPQPDPSPIIKPLRPARSRPMSNLRPPGPPPDSPTPSRPKSGSSYGSSRPSSGLSTSVPFDELSTNPLFLAAKKKHSPEKRIFDHASEDDTTSSRRPLAPGAKKMLGMKGTMGGSDISAYDESEGVDRSDPDSDIPGELQVILDDNKRRSMDDAIDFGRLSSSMSTPEDDVPSNVSPPSSPIPPVFKVQVIDEQDNHADIEEDDGMMISDEDKTTKSFDFTGELQKLNESGGSDRHSFMEQLENAFKTPAKVDLRYDFGGLLTADVPPIPPLPKLENGYSDDSYSATRQSEQCSGPATSKGFSQVKECPSEEAIIKVEPPTFIRDRSDNVRDLKMKKSFDMFTTSELRNMIDPSFRPNMDDYDSHDEEECPPTTIPRHASSGSQGELNRSFRFGGSSTSPPKGKQSTMTLSDIIPSPAHARSLSMGDDDSVLKSIMAKAADVQAAPTARPRVDSAISFGMDNSRHSRAPSEMSFVGFDSFEEVRRGFEFHDHRPAFYPPQPTMSASAVPHYLRNESVFSIASVSSYGHVVNPGIADPFEYGDYGLPSLAERPSSEDLTNASFSVSMNVDDTFEFHDRARKHKRVDSDTSSFYFRPGPIGARRTHRRNESSVASQFPPISRYNRSFGIHSQSHHRDDSSTSMSSIAHSYANGRVAWTRHRQEASVDSVASDFSVMRLGRPGVGDKMFSTAMENGPLTSISASPSSSFVDGRSDSNYDNRSSYDSILDFNRSDSAEEDSLFDRTGMRSSGTDDFTFGGGDHLGHLAPPVYRPLSVLSFNDRSIHSRREDDTMISMLGGGHERRESIGSLIDKSPCVRVEKRKHSELRAAHNIKGDGNGMPRKAHIAPQPSIASTLDSVKFGEERMIRATHGHLDRRSLEESCLVADGEDLSFSFSAHPVFSRPSAGSRSRSSTYTSSSGVDTPPLSSSDGSSSMSDGSQSSIDLSLINLALSNTTHPMTHAQRTRMRARGQGHRRRFSQARASRSSVYETINEEFSSPEKASPDSKKSSSPTQVQPVFIVDEDNASIHSATETWDDERGISALRRYYELRNEAEYIVEESKRVWQDTPFSLFAVQSFEPPKNPSGMQAMLNHSVQNYGPLPSELRARRMRSRTSSRASPYPSTRALKASASPEIVTKNQSAALYRNATSSPLREIEQNVAIAPLALSKAKPFASDAEGELRIKNAIGLPARPRVGSTARRTALGWTKRGSGNGKASSDLKENQYTPTFNMTPGESLRLSRPRPKGRPTPARAARV